MNPINQFEQCLRQVSASNLPAADKSRKMLEVSKAIEHYLHRVEAMKVQSAQQAAIDQAKVQLRELSAQATELASVYGKNGATLH